MSRAWEHSEERCQWELVTYHEDVPRQIRERLVLASVTDEFIERVAVPALAAARLRARVGSVPPPWADLVPSTRPPAVIWEL